MEKLRTAAATFGKLPAEKEWSEAERVYKDAVVTENTARLVVAFKSDMTKVNLRKFVQQRLKALRSEDVEEAALPPMLSKRCQSALKLQ